jgi:hypothetical protein
MNLTGNVNLLKLEKAGIATIKNKKCVVIPIEENDLYVSMDENLKAKAVYLNVNINERREPSQYGNTHYCKQYLSKQYKDANKKPSQRFTWETSSLMSLRVPGMPQLRWKRLLCRLMMIHSHFRI